MCHWQMQLDILELTLQAASPCICPQDSRFGWAGLGINGFGRIGRLVFRAAMANPDVELKVRYDLRAKRELKS